MLRDETWMHNLTIGDNIMKKLLSVLNATILGLSTFSAFAYDIPAGPIWNNDDAKAKCPQVCANFGGWNQQWVTTIQGQMSVCGCNVNAGKGPCG